MILKATNLNKRYGGRYVVKDMSLSVEQGEIVGILGPNGAGKTTTFYMLAGITRPESGEIFIGDKNITKFSIHQRSLWGMGYLPQEASVFRKLTVFENIMAALQISGKYVGDKIKRCEELIGEFGLEKVKNEYGYSLSGGERRRVEIARCLATEPKYILLDEPFAGIDPISVADIQRMIFELKKKGIGVLITDHNVRETLKITDRSYIVFEGSILASGSVADILSNEKVIKSYLGEGFAI